MSMSDTSGANRLTLAEARDALRKGDLSAVDLTMSCLTAMDAGDALSAYVHKTPEIALDQARAEGEDPAEAVQVPDEFDYRYPGPKPRTKETAIVMLSDAIESTTRTLPEPTPARIEAVVSTIAQARLADGQFDDCEITLRDVSAICESITKTLTSIYHGRVTYASTADIARRRA